MSNAIEFTGVSKSYPLYSSPADRFKELATFGVLRRHETFDALHDVSFAVPKGSTFCLVGENGSGKSTSLQLAAGIMQPSSGTVQAQGRISALLELGAGFNPEFSGRENVDLNASLLGLSQSEIADRLDSILEFAEIGEFLEQPVKTYSSGMLVRLAFAVAIHVEPEILLVDEALAVGDFYFRQRCLRKIHEMRRAGVTIVFVSHSMADVKALGTHALWLENGRVVELGAPDAVVARYLAKMVAKDAKYQSHVRVETGAARELAPEVVEDLPNVDTRHGDGRAEVLGIAACNDAGERVGEMRPGETCVVRVSVRAKQALAQPNVGFMLRNHLGIDFAGSNTAREGITLPAMAAGDVYTVDFHITVPELYPGTFSFSPAVADGPLGAYAMCDWVENALALPMAAGGDGEVYGYMHLPCRVTVNERLAPAPAENSWAQ